MANSYLPAFLSSTPPAWKVLPIYPASVSSQDLSVTFSGKISLTLFVHLVNIFWHTHTACAILFSNRRSNPPGDCVLTTGQPPGKFQHCPLCTPLRNEFKCPFPVPPTRHESSASSLTQLITQYCSCMFTCWLKGILHGGKEHFFPLQHSFWLE